MPKLIDTRITVFKEDYNPQRDALKKAGKPSGEETGKVLYRKGVKYAIHYKVLEKLIKRGAKFTAEKYDLQAALSERKAKLKKAA